MISPAVIPEDLPIAHLEAILAWASGEQFLQQPSKKLMICGTESCAQARHVPFLVM
jgi:hypothetical protein